MDQLKLISGLINKISPLTNYSFADRLASQKIIFIAQSKMKDFPTNYSFRLYISGPYSAVLADDMYKIGKTGKYGYLKFKDQIKEEMWTRFALEIRPYLNRIDILELIGTIVFLENNHFSGDNLLEKLKQIKPNFNNSKYEEALNVVKKINSIFHCGL